MSNTAIAPAAPASKSPANSAANKDEWTKEIHTPESTFNANVPCDLIVRNPGNRMPTDESVAALARTIEAEGLLQPIALRQLADGKYMIIAGETRWLAFRLLKRPTIPAHIRKGEADDAGDTAKRLIENLSRTDLPVIDKARGFKQLDVTELSRVAVAVLITKEVDDAAKNAWGMPENVERIMNSKVPSGDKAAAAAPAGVLIDVAPAPKSKKTKPAKAVKKGGKK